MNKQKTTIYWYPQLLFFFQFVSWTPEMELPIAIAKYQETQGSYAEQPTPTFITRVGRPTSFQPWWAAGTS